MVVQNNENGQRKGERYDDCCEDYCCRVYREMAEIDKDGRIMKRMAINLYTSLAVSTTVLFLLDDIDAFLTSFVACVIMGMSTEVFDNKKLAALAVPR